MQAQPSALYPQLRHFAWRLRLRDTLQTAQRTAWVPGTGLGIVQLAGHIVPIPHLNTWNWLPLGLWLCCLLILVLLWRERAVVTARRVDLLLRLHERLSTAVERSSLAAPAELDRQQHADAIATLSGLKASQIGWGVQRQAVAWFVLPLMLGIALMLVPNPQNAVLARQAAVAQTIAQVVKSVDAQRESVLKDKELTPAERQRLAAELAGLQKALQGPRTAREEALARLSETEASVRSRLDPQADARQTGLAQLAQQLAQAQDPSQQAANPATAGDALDHTAQTLDTLTPQQRAALQKLLAQQATANASSNPPLSQQLQQSADALSQGDNATATKSLQQAGQVARQTGAGLADNQAQQQTISGLQGSRQAIAEAGQAQSGGQQSAAQPSTGQPGSQGQAGGGQPQQPGGGQAQGAGQQASGGPTQGASQPAGQGQQAGGGQAQGAGQPAGQGQQASGGQAQGAGQQAGAGQGQGQLPGQSGGTNANSLGNNTSNSPGNVQPNGGVGQGQGTGKANTVYQPFSPTGQQGKPEQATGQQGSSGQAPITPGQYGAGQGNQPLVPYQQVYRQYHNAAEQALDSSAIPPHLKSYVRDYFTQLNPEPQQGP